MKHLLRLLSIIILFHTIVSAQESGLQVRLQRLENRLNWELITSIELDENPGTALLVELPDYIKAVPQSIRLNGQELWLKNSAGPCTSDTAMHWERVDAGIVLHCTADRLQPGDRLELSFMAPIARRTTEERPVTLRKWNPVDSLSGEIIATQNVNITE